MEELVPPWVMEDGRREEDQEEEDEDELSKKFILEELYRALKMIRRDSSLGLDKVDYQMLENLPMVGKKCF